jgi:tRNA dimethylallyltransferase
VSLSAKQPMTEQWERGRDALRGFTILRIGLDPDRALLYERIHRRVEKMFEAGLMEETRHLREKYGDAARPLETIGYKQVVQLLRGEIDRKQAIAAVQQAHRNYAKRQMTWFRREPAVEWIAGFGDESGVVEQAVKLVHERS